MKKFNNLLEQILSIPESFKNWMIVLAMVFSIAPWSFCVLIICSSEGFFVDQEISVFEWCSFCISCISVQATILMGVASVIVAMHIDGINKDFHMQEIRTMFVPECITIKLKFSESDKDSDKLQLRFWFPDQVLSLDYKVKNATWQYINDEASSRYTATVANDKNTSTCIELLIDYTDIEQWVNSQSRGGFDHACIRLCLCIEYTANTASKDLQSVRIIMVLEHSDNRVNMIYKAIRNEPEGI
ncbi:MAG: hypothetical protein K2H01_11015 [Ruminococcus sp.]|nr:hypothetical protein [Ruminococcus sp.]